MVGRKGQMDTHTCHTLDKCASHGLHQVFRAEANGSPYPPGFLGCPPGLKLEGDTKEPAPPPFPHSGAGHGHWRSNWQSSSCN